MVGRYQAARVDPYLASHGVLALLGIERPTVDQEVGALVVSEFIVRVIGFLSPKKG
jgi:hypothetical protein